MQFFEAPNGKIWPQINGVVTGVVAMPWLPEDATADMRHEAVEEEFFGEYLDDSATKDLGDDVTHVSTVSLGRWVEVPADSPEIAPALKEQYDLLDTELVHLMANLDNTYGEEHVLAIAGTAREVRSPAFPEPCSYVRVTVGGLEVAYWTFDEWAQDPQVVMGAILGASSPGLGDAP